jgi:HK97 family phage prohead protease
MKLQFNGASLSVDAADSDGPRISGIAVPYNVDASVSTGQTVRIIEGALPTDGRMPRLVLEHDTSRVVGVVDQRQDTPEGMLFSARIADTAEGRDLIALLKMGALDSVSVGIMATEHEQDGRTMVIKSATWEELSVVYQPAFEGALITEIAASKDADEPQPLDISEEEQTMSQENTTVEAAAQIVPTTPIFAQARPEFKLPSISEYLSKFLTGGSEWAQFNSNIKAAAPNVLVADLDGVVPEIWTQPVYSSLRGIRPVIDAVGVKAMPQAGKIFIRPKVTTHTTIGASNGENVALDQGTFVVADLQVTKGVYGGYVKVSEESIDWSQPEVVALILDDMAKEYAKQTDNVAADNLVAGATNTTNFTVADITDPAEWARWMYTSAEAILTANQYLPTHLFLSANMWRAMAQLVDGSDRPLFPQYGPQNAFGNMTPTGSAREAFGFSVVVDANFANDTIIVGVPDGYEIFEQNKGAISAESNDGSLSRTLAFRGYFATLMIDVDKFEKAAFV